MLRAKDRHMQPGADLAPPGRACTAACTLLRGHAGWRHTGQRKARRNRKQLRDVRSTRRRKGQRTRNQLGTQPNWLGLAEPWLRVMSRKVFCSETDASGMS